MFSRIAFVALAALLMVVAPPVSAGQSLSADNAPTIKAAGPQAVADPSEQNQTSGRTAPKQDSAHVIPPSVVRLSVQPAALPAPSPGQDQGNGNTYRGDNGNRGGGGDRGGRGGQGGHGGRGDHGGWRPPDRPPHDRHGQWRRDRYSHFGFWHFLIFGGARFWWPPHSSSVVRIPRHGGIYVQQNGDDAIGRNFASALRSELESQGLNVVYYQDDAAMELYVVSMEENPNDPGYGSAVSVSYIAMPGHRFITAQMLDVGDEQVDELAGVTADYVVKLREDYR